MSIFDLNDLVEEVATHLEDFTPLIRPGHPAYLVAGGDARLAVHPLLRPSGRISVAGIHPDGCRGHISGLQRHVICVTTRRGARYIARKIKRGLLPGYLRDLRICRKQQIAAMVKRGARKEFAEKLLTILPSPTEIEEEQKTVVRWGHGSISGSFDVYGDCAINDLQIGAADRDLAERVAHVIRKYSA